MLGQGLLFQVAEAVLDAAIGLNFRSNELSVFLVILLKVFEHDLLLSHFVFVFDKVEESRSESLVSQGLDDVHLSGNDLIFYLFSGNGLGLLLIKRSAH